MEVMEQDYNWYTTSKITNHRSNSNRSSNDRKRKGVKSYSHTNFRRANLASARKIMHAIIVIGWPVRKHACFMALDTPWRSLKCLRNTPKSIPCSGPRKKMLTSEGNQAWENGQNWCKSEWGEHHGRPRQFNHQKEEKGKNHMKNHKS